ncbi:MAG: PAS domain S-box protein [Bacteroidia bacterium]
MSLSLKNNYNSKVSDALFNDSPISIFILNNEGAVKSANNSAVKLLKSTIIDIQSKTIFELFPEINLIFPKAWWQKLYYSNNKELSTQIINEKNEAIPVKIEVMLNVDFDVHLVYVTVVTEPIYKKNSLLKSEDKLAAFFDSSNDLISIISPQKTILSFNKLFEHYVKVVFDLQVTEGDDIIDFIVNENRNGFIENFEKALKGLEVNFEKEVFYNELAIWWHITYMPIRNSNGEVLAVAFVLKNIDDRKIAEEALIRSEEKYKLVVAGLNEGWWDWDLTNNLVFYSPKWWNNIGYENNELVNIPNYWEKIIHPNDKERVQSAFQKALLSNKKTYEIEYRAKHKDGHFVPMFSRGYFLRNELGKAIRVSGSDMDLTERKHSENLLLENQRKLHIAQNLAFLGNYEINTIDFKFQASQTTYDILGIDENFIQSVDDFKRLIHFEDLDKVQYYFQKNESDNAIYTCEFRIINNKTGEIRWISDFSNIEFNENKIATRVIGAIQDITARKNIEFDIQKNETKYRSLIENMDLGILEVDNFEIITKVYPKFCELVGYSESELLGKNALEVFLPVNKHNEFVSVKEVRKKGISSAYEIQIMHKNGEPIDVIISGTPLFDKDGKVYGSIGIHYNITERKRNESDLKKSFDLVTEQNKRLLNFSYIVSHNLRSHSSNITSLLNILNTTESEIEKDEIISHLNSVSSLLNETLNNLNEVVSIQNNIDVVIEPIQVNRQVSKILVLLNSQIELRNIQIFNEIRDDLFINFNPSYFESIVYNLISNSVKYSNLKTQSFVKICSFILDNKIGLSIEDNGIGIDLNKNGEKLFGMYKTFNGNNDARGIGLFITKDQIETLGGKIEVISELGIGTTFKILFK